MEYAWMCPVSLQFWPKWAKNNQWRYITKRWKLCSRCHVFYCRNFVVLFCANDFMVHHKVINLLFGYVYYIVEAYKTRHPNRLMILVVFVVFLSFRFRESMDVAPRSDIINNEIMQLNVFQVASSFSHTGFACCFPRHRSFVQRTHNFECTWRAF